MRYYINIISSLFLAALTIVGVILLVFMRNQIYWLLISLVIVLVFDLIFAWIILVSDRLNCIKVSWIFVVLSLPLVGVLIFTIFGVRPLTKKKRIEYLKRESKYSRYEKFDFSREYIYQYSKNNKSFSNIFNLAYYAAKRPIYENNNFKIIDEGIKYKNAILYLINNAKKFIHLEYYILKEGTFLDEIINALIKKASEGIEVRLIYDWVGCAGKISIKLLYKLKKNNIQVGVFNYYKNPLHGGTNFRTHRKFIIVDNQYAITGSANIGDEYISKNKYFGYWRDINIYIEGDIVNTLNLIFASDWETYTTHFSKQKREKRLISNNSKYFKLVSENKNFNDKAIAQVIDAGPDYEIKQINDLILKSINEAKKKVWLCTPYFMPTEEISTVLRTAALCNVDVRIMIPGFADNKKYIINLSKQQEFNLLDSKIKFYEYQSFNHAKFLILDEDVVFIGTNNIDARSLFINFELGILIKNKNVNKDLSNIFLNDLTNSKQITNLNVKKYNFFYRKIYLGIISIFYPLL